MAIKVVVIEDEEFLTELIRVNLKLRGIDVTTAEYGEDGYAKILEKKTRFNSAGCQTSGY
jgi:DNA-binding response OmpR family regulator